MAPKATQRAVVRLAAAAAAAVVLKVVKWRQKGKREEGGKEKWQIGRASERASELEARFEVHKKKTATRREHR